MAAKNILTALQVEKAKPGFKPVKSINKNGGPSSTEIIPIHKDYKLTDGGGLHLFVKLNGSKWWHFRYQFHGEKKISLGVYPEVCLADAREKRDECQRELSKGINPSTSRKDSRRASSQDRTNTFSVISNKWLTKIFSGHSKSADHRKRVRARFENDLFPALGERPIADITAQEILTAIGKIEGRGCLETAQRTLGSCSEVFAYAKTLGYCQQDVTDGISSLLQRPVRSHFPAITKGEHAAPLLQAVWNYRGTAVVQSAFRLNPYLFCRPGELRTMEWLSVDFERREWLLRLEKDQSRKSASRNEEAIDEYLIVPLAPQVCQILWDLKSITGGGKYVFPGQRSIEKPMSDGAVREALKTIGYPGTIHTGHGFRAMARTMIVDELKIQEHLIEHELGHIQRFPNGRAYDRASYLQERDLMMRQWADYLDDLRVGKPVRGNAPLEDVRAIQKSQYY
ncbi:MAG: integrase arm-type DNA-binding domain-containing protein [Terracidiphilus sp.]|jgi:integrase